MATIQLLGPVHHEKALTLTEEIAEPYERTRALCGIGRINQETGGHHAALDRYGQAITEARKIGESTTWPRESLCPVLAQRD
jgi:hypothetical protein